MARPGDVWAHRFGKLLEVYPHPGGRPWRGVDLERATNGYLNGSYITALRKGRIDEPGLNKLSRIAEVMGFPLELWFRDLDDHPKKNPLHSGQVGGTSIADRLNLLFDVVLNDRTGKPFDEREVARASKGRLGELDVVRMRTGELKDPTRIQLLALSEVFDVDFSYWAESFDENTLTADTLRALRDTTSQDILHKSFELSEDDKHLVVTMLEELRRRRTAKDERG